MFAMEFFYARHWKTPSYLVVKFISHNNLDHYSYPNVEADVDRQSNILKLQI